MSRFIQITEPFGDVATYESTAKLVDAMEDARGDFWNPRSPVLQVSVSAPRFELMLIRHRRRGWYALYSAFEPERRHLVAIEPTNFSEKWVELWAFDKVAIVPERNVVPTSVAKRIVEDYCESQEPSTHATWHDFDWDLHMRESLHESWIAERADPPA